MSRIIKRKRVKLALLATLAAGVAPFASAQPAHAGVVGCVQSNVSIGAIYPAALVNCTLDKTGTCIFNYDPLFGFPNQVVGETVAFPLCVAL